MCAQNTPSCDLLALLENAAQAIEAHDNDKLTAILASLEASSAAELVNLTDAEGETLMIKALRQKFPDAKTVEVIRSVKGFNPEIRDKRLKLTALFFAYMTRQKEIFEQFLYDERVNLNARDSTGETVLIREVIRSSANFPNEEIIMQIANHPRVDVTLMDFTHRDALSYAKEREASTSRGYYQIAVKLENARIKKQITRALEPLIKEQKYLRRRVARLMQTNKELQRKLNERQYK